MHNTKVQGSLMVVLEEERSMLREREREFEHKRGFMILVISHFSHINFTIHQRSIESIGKSTQKVGL